MSLCRVTYNSNTNHVPLPSHIQLKHKPCPSAESHTTQTQPGSLCRVTYNSNTTRVPLPSHIQLKHKPCPSAESHTTQTQTVSLCRVTESHTTQTQTMSLCRVTYNSNTTGVPLPSHIQLKHNRGPSAESHTNQTQPGSLCRVTYNLNTPQNSNRVPCTDAQYRATFFYLQTQALNLRVNCLDVGRTGTN